MKSSSRSTATSFVAAMCLSGVLIVSFYSCKKGDKGDTGATGNANVIYSEWFTPGTYQKDTLFGIWGFRHNQPAPEITQAVLDSGVILTYAKLLGYNPAVWPEGQVAPMPVQITYMQGGVTTDTWSALSTVGNLRIRFINDRNIYTTISNTHQFRYVIIPGGKKATVGVSLTNRINSSGEGVLTYEDIKYNELCTLFNIPR